MRANMLSAAAEPYPQNLAAVSLQLSLELLTCKRKQGREWVTKSLSKRFQTQHSQVKQITDYVTRHVEGSARQFSYWILLYFCSVTVLFLICFSWDAVHDNEMYMLMSCMLKTVKTCPQACFSEKLSFLKTLSDNKTVIRRSWIYTYSISEICIRKYWKSLKYLKISAMLARLMNTGIRHPGRVSSKSYWIYWCTTSTLYWAWSVTMSSLADAGFPL